MINTFIEYYDRILKALNETIIMFGIALAFGLVLGLVLGIILYITSKNGLSPNKIIYNILGFIVNITRSIPFILLAIILIPFTRIVVGRAFGTVAASVPLTIISIALFSRFTEQSLNSVNLNIINTAKVMGATKKQIIFDFLLKEVRPNLILGFTSAIISIISYSTIMGILGGGGIGDFAIYHGYTANNRSLMYVVIIIMIILVSVVQIIGNILARKLDKTRK